MWWEPKDRLDRCIRRVMAPAAPGAGRAWDGSVLGVFLLGCDFGLQVGDLLLELLDAAWRTSFFSSSVLRKLILIASFSQTPPLEPLNSATPPA